MKKQLQRIATELKEMSLKHPEISDLAGMAQLYADKCEEDSVSSSETNDNENTDDGGIEVPKKPPPP